MASTQIPLLINGKMITTSKSFPVIAPKTDKELYTASAASLSDADAAVSAASSAFPSWRDTKPGYRRELLFKVADLLESRKDEFVEAMQNECVADDTWVGFNIKTGADITRDVGGRLASVLEGKIPECEQPDTHALIYKDPFGAILAIAPWNAPIILSIRAIVFPLAAGNTVVFKGSEASPKTHFLILDIFQKAGFPPGVVNFILHSREDAPTITEALIASPDIKKVNFTGSTAVGRKIATIAGKNLKPVVLELGGKAPFIVLEDADIEAAAGAAAFGAFQYAGQICMATEKILVQKSVTQKFLEALKPAVKKRYGEKQTLVLPAGPDKIRSLVSSATDAGASSHLNGADSYDKQEHPNMIITDVDDSMDLYHTESFGPVVAVFEIEDEEEAIRKANDTEYGLSAAVWTKDLGKALKMAKRIESGAVHINGPTVHDEAGLPHGGRKSSGHGRFGADWGLAEWVTSKTVTFRV